jgi:NADP-dependent 3-hydroxy acid dehydrogenase YdfG
MAKFPPHPERRPAVVSGASSGIGRAAAVLLAGAGHPVVLGARRVERCEEAAAEIRAAGGEAVALPLDVCDVASVAAFAKDAEAAVGPIEVVVSNAGDVVPMSAIDADPVDFERQVSVNLLGPQRLVHHLGPAMVERRRGDIVLVTSDVAQRVRPLLAGYVAGKHGLEGVAQAMRLELEGTGVRVGMVRPGPSTTEQGASWTAEQVDAVLAEWGRHGLMRHGGYLRPEQVANAVLAMISAPRGSHFTVIEVQPESPIETEGER